MNQENTKFEIKITTKTEYVTKPVDLYKKSINQSLNKQLEILTFANPHLEIEVSREDKLPLTQEDINFVTEYIKKAFTPKKITYI